MRQQEKGQCMLQQYDSQERCNECCNNMRHQEQSHGFCNSYEATGKGVMHVETGRPHQERCNACCKSYNALGNILTINVPVVIMARYGMVLRGAISLRGALEGVGPENQDFFGPKVLVHNMGLRYIKCMLQPLERPKYDALSKEPNFCQVHLAGQYLK